MERLVIVGAGGFGRETADAVEAMQSGGVDVELLGIVDDMPSEENLVRLRQRRIHFLGGVADFVRRGGSASYVIGVGSPAVRARLAALLDGAGLTAATVVHPHSTIGSAVQIAAGTVVCAGARVATNVTLGRHTHLNANCTVGHDTVLEDFVSVNPGALVSGDCRVGQGTLIGVGATILQGVAVGKNSVVGGSACVTRPVGDDVVVKGVPAR